MPSTPKHFISRPGPQLAPSTLSAMHSIRYARGSERWFSQGPLLCSARQLQAKADTPLHVQCWNQLDKSHQAGEAFCLYPLAGKPAPSFSTWICQTKTKQSTGNSFLAETDQRRWLPCWELPSCPKQEVRERRRGQTRVGWAGTRQQGRSSSNPGASTSAGGKGWVWGKFSVTKFCTKK